MTTTELVRITEDTPDLPALDPGKATAVAVRQYTQFKHEIAEIFEAWVSRRKAERTRSAYRNHVMQFVRWLGIPWPEYDHLLLAVKKRHVQRYTDELRETGSANKTINARLSAISRFYECLRGEAAERRIPVTLPNPASSEWNPRLSDRPERKARPLTVDQMHEALSLPKGEDEVAYRDRALLLLAFALGLRGSSIRKLEVTDVFEHPEDGAIARIWIKGDEIEERGLHPKAWVAVKQYKERVGIQVGPLFRPRANRNTTLLASRPMSASSVERVLKRYLYQVPGGTEPVEVDGEVVERPLFRPHSVRATTATVLDKQGVHRPKIQHLLAHKKPETTDGYCENEWAGRESASHAMPL